MKRSSPGTIIFFDEIHTACIPMQVRIPVPGFIIFLCIRFSNIHLGQ